MIEHVEIWKNILRREAADVVLVYPGFNVIVVDSPTTTISRHSFVFMDENGGRLFSADVNFFRASGFYATDMIRKKIYNGICSFERVPYDMTKSFMELNLECPQEIADEHLMKLILIES